jgi:hypothetical protein
MKGRIAKTTDRDAPHLRTMLRLPPNRRAAVWAEVEIHSAAAVALAAVNLVGTLGLNLSPRKICAQVSEGTSATLACHAVAQLNSAWLARHDDSQLIALTLRDAFHPDLPSGFAPSFP